VASSRERLKTALAGTYTVERLIGAGGMAAVYLAHDVKHDRKVAVKVLRPELAEALGSRRFLREISVTAKLDHPHIVSVHDSGEADGIVYYVMPYVEGESLRQRLDRLGHLDLDESVAIVRDVAGALQYAHEREVIHRDIKPENVLLSAGHARVVDFGLARALNQAGGTRLTETGIAVGTPEYMSPEQCIGVTHLDARTDVYALGCLTFEMLTGRPPFSEGPAQVILMQQARQSPPRLASLRPDLPKTVTRAVGRTLAKDPERRFDSVTAFVDALTGIRSATEASRTLLVAVAITAVLVITALVVGFLLL
jgi:serine/threonine protein kinase